MRVIELAPIGPAARTEGAMSRLIAIIALMAGCGSSTCDLDRYPNRCADGSIMAVCCDDKKPPRGVEGCAFVLSSGRDVPCDGSCDVDFVAQADAEDICYPEGAPLATTSSSTDCIPAAQCCKVCDASQACGDSCIANDLNCSQPDGCACEEWEVCR